MTFKFKNSSGSCTINQVSEKKVFFYDFNNYNDLYEKNFIS